jgi:leucine-zipper of insertion element IS481
LVDRILVDDGKPADAAAETSVSRQWFRWVARFFDEGSAGLADRSSRLSQVTTPVLRRS